MSDKKAIDSTSENANATEATNELRSLVAELRDSGIPLAAAVTDAAHALGNSGKQATPFGAGLPWWRTTLAAGAQLVLLLYSLASSGWPDRWIGSFEMIAGIALIGCVFARSGWARAILLGTMLFQLGWILFAEVTLPEGTSISVGVVALIGVTSVMLAPWRRTEMRWPSVALAALYPAYVSVAWLTVIDLQKFTHGPISTRVAASATIAILMTAVGIIVRARWAAVGAAYSAAVAGVAFVVVAMVPAAPYSSAMWSLDELVMLITGVGATCATMIAVVAWRSARSTFGTLRDVRG